MITLVCVLIGLAVFELYLIIVLAIALRREHQYSEEVQPIDLVAFEKEWRSIHDD